MEKSTIIILIGIFLFVVTALIYSPLPIEYDIEYDEDGTEVWVFNGKDFLVDIVGWFGACLIPLLIIYWGWRKKRKK